MKNESQYRFNIQFTAKTDDEIMAGEFINSLGRRKGLFIVATVIEYLNNHKELSSNSKHIHVSTVSADQLEAKIRAIIDEKLACLPAEVRLAPALPPETTQISSDIADMLEDLELFASF